MKRVKKPKYKRITKRKLYKLVTEKLIPILNLSDWKIKVTFTKKMKDLADCEAMPEYKSAVIRVHYIELRELSFHEIIAVALHELIHCVTWPMSSWNEQLSRNNDDKLEMGRRMDESLTTDIEQVLFPLVAPIIFNELRELGYGNLEEVPVLNID